MGSRACVLHSRNMLILSPDSLKFEGFADVVRWSVIVFFCWWLEGRFYEVMINYFLPWDGEQ